MHRLVSAAEKRRFFQQMDGLQAADSAPSPSVTCTSAVSASFVSKRSLKHQESAQISLEMVTTRQPSSHQNASATTTPTKRQLPQLGAKPRGKTAGDPREPKKSRVSSGLQSPTSTTGPLIGKSVSVVPVGMDVTPKRVAIWQEMVGKLGGQCVAIEKAVDCGGKDVAKVDFLVVSEQLSDVGKVLDTYKLQQLPSQVKWMKPEWLVQMMKTQQLPRGQQEALWRWNPTEAAAKAVPQEKTPLPNAQMSREQPKPRAWSKQTKSQELAESDSEESSGARYIVPESEEEEDAKGGDKTTRRVAKQAQLVEEDRQLQERKAKLVKERLAAFYQNNPGFKGIHSAEDTHKYTAKSETFACQKTSMLLQNLNSHLTDPLEELMEYLHVERDVWREYSYKKVIASLKTMRTRITTARDLKGLWWATGRMKQKVIELLESGRMDKLEAKKSSPRLQTLVQFSRIWGVGPATASKLYNQGFKSLEDLRQRGDEVLSYQQKIGLKHYQDFLTKIPRSEAAEIEKTVVNLVHELVPAAIASACGSYRRGKMATGDVDVLITDPDEDECEVLPELIQRLHEKGFLTDDLVQQSEYRVGHSHTYMGVCRLHPDLPFRRIDIKVYPRRLFGFALLYFTGSDHFNRSMRLYARKHGWSLSDHSLIKVIRQRDGSKIEVGESVVCMSEVDVFIALGLEYKDPLERNCFDIRFLDEDEALAKRTGDPAATSLPGATQAS